MHPTKTHTYLDHQLCAGSLHLLRAHHLPTVGQRSLSACLLQERISYVRLIRCGAIVAMRLRAAVRMPLVVVAVLATQAFHTSFVDAQTPLRCPPSINAGCVYKCHVNSANTCFNLMRDGSSRVVAGCHSCTQCESNRRSRCKYFFCMLLGLRRVRVRGALGTQDSA